MLIQIDPSVVMKAQRGDEEAFSVIVRTYHTPIFNYVLRSVGDREHAEDLTQDVFLRVWRALPKYAFRAKLSTWIFQVAKNVVLDDIRSKKNRLQPVELVPELAPAAPEAPVEQADAIRALWVAVEQLSVDLKTALVLRDVIGLSYNEIAATLDIPLATVKWRIYSARNEVQLALAEAGITFGSTDEPGAIAETG
ncbi:MAG TPA: RNA polymerase sigma factor [Gaiellaceae bacterium]|nr:RNA polymerase sigma factor [Gaiellaceae bacterium]